MQKYIGTKQIKAEQMTLGDYNEYRSWDIPKDEDPLREGYLVKYSDGYESWSPKEVFKAAYRLCDNMTFGLAIEALKSGHKVARVGWNGKNMFLFLVKESIIHEDQARSGVAKCIADENLNKRIPSEDKLIHVCSHIDMRSADRKCVVGWLASQTDMLAEDWSIV